MQPARALALRRDRLFRDVDELSRAQRLLVLRVEEVGFRLRVEVVVGLAEQLVAAPAEQLFARAVEADEHVILGALDEDHVGDVFDDGYLPHFFQVMYHDIGVNRSYSVVPKQTVNRQEKTVDVALHFVPKK